MLGPIATITTNVQTPLNFIPDQLAAPDFDAGAMENWGLVLYRESLLLWDPDIDTTGDKYSITSVIGHELAHQVKR